MTVQPAVRPTLLRQMDMGSLTYAHIWVRAVHTNVCVGGGRGGGGSNNTDDDTLMRSRGKKRTKSRHGGESGCQ